MKKLLLILLAFIAVFTYIRLFDNANTLESPPASDIPAVISAEFTWEKPVEIIQ
ncbi:MAG: hypothetical protein LBI12_05395 [Treponema sp.]|jgi:hypothetical protein|nr:hypothetical protein [Treponema sp.]